MLIGLCGAQGSGKTTAANLLLGKNPSQQLIAPAKPQSINPKKFIQEQLQVSSETVEKLMHEWVDPDWTWDWCSRYFPISQDFPNNDWRQVSFADPLKRACSILFNYPYHILLGEDQRAREIREQLTTSHYSICGALSGRQLLQYFGTEVIRNNLSKTFWVDLSVKTIDYYLLSGNNVIISDVRFPNEADIIKLKGGSIIQISRLVEKTSKEERLKHESERFFSQLSADLVIENNGSLNELRIKLERALHSLNYSHPLKV